MESCSNQTTNQNIFYILQSSHPLPLTALHTLGIFSTHFTWNPFPTVWKESPHLLSTCWLLFLHSAVQLIPNHLNWVEVVRLWRTGHLMQHSITLLLGQIALTQPGGVLGQVIVLLKNKWYPIWFVLSGTGVSLQNAGVAMLVKCALNSK